MTQHKVLTCGLAAGEGSQRDRRRPQKVASLLLGALVATVLCASGAAAQDSPDLLPEGAGRDETFYICSACHGFEIVVQQGMARRQWDETITYMTDRHGMPPLEGDDREIVLNYLTEHWPARQRRGATNPFLR